MPHSDCRVLCRTRLLSFCSIRASRLALALAFTLAFALVPYCFFGAQSSWHIGTTSITGSHAPQRCIILQQISQYYPISQQDAFSLPRALPSTGESYHGEIASAYQLSLVDNGFAERA